MYPGCRWRRYRNLWKYDKQQTCEKFVSRQPSLVAWDDKFLFYKQIMEDVNTTASQMNAQSVKYDRAYFVKAPRLNFE